jgi:hypothetical protein
VLFDVKFRVSEANVNETTASYDNAQFHTRLFQLCLRSYESSGRRYRHFKHNSSVLQWFSEVIV